MALWARLEQSYRTLKFYMTIMLAEMEVQQGFSSILVLCREPLELLKINIVMPEAMAITLSKFDIDPTEISN